MDNVEVMEKIVILAKQIVEAANSVEMEAVIIMSNAGMDKVDALIVEVAEH